MALALSPRIRCSPSATTDPPLPNPCPPHQGCDFGQAFPLSELQVPSLLHEDESAYHMNVS